MNENNRSTIMLKIRPEQFTVVADGHFYGLAYATRLVPSRILLLSHRPVVEAGIGLSEHLRFS